jgi:hypothetical protein
MTLLQKFAVTLLMTLGIYCLLTLPFFIAFFTLDINTGHYYGLIYPTWFVYTCSIISVIFGNLIGNYLYNKSKK